MTVESEKDRRGAQGAPPPAAVVMRGIVKRFPGVLANDRVDFEAAAGEVHALLGENGAGKSTLSNILTGLYRPDAGEIFLDGQIGPIGGAKQKTIGARQSGVDILLVPAGDNAATARKYAGHMRVIAVDSFRQALRMLATLPRKH